MRKVRPTQFDLAYIWEGFNSTAPASAATSKLVFCVKNAREWGRNAWQQPELRKSWQELARDALIDARYWQAALVKHAA